MTSKFSSTASQPIAVLAALVLFALSPLVFSADEKGKSSSSCTPQMITEMKSALTECMPQKGGSSGGAEKGGSKGGKSGNLLDAERVLDIEPRLAYLKQSGGGSGQSSGEGNSKGSDGASAKGGAKGGANDTSALACTLTKIKGKSKIIDDVMTQCSSSSSNSSSDSKGSKSQSSGSSQSQKEKPHAGGKEGGSGGSGAGGATSPVDACILLKFQDVCPEFQADPTVAAVFPSQSSSGGDDKKHSKN